MVQDDNRSRQTWLIVAYLICNRHRTVTQGELARLLAVERRGVNPAGVLKTAVWRVRKTLKPLSDELGCELVETSRGGGYVFTNNIEVDVDVDRFEELLRSASASKEGLYRLQAYAEAAALYSNGRFLQRHVGDEWADSMSLCYEGDFVKLAHEAIPLMLDQCGQDLARDAERLARDALFLSPFDEELHYLLLRSLANQDRCADAVVEYERIRDMLLMELGVDPGEKTQELYRKLQNNVAAPGLTVPELVSRLREEDPGKGPLICDFARFKLHYQAEARSAARRGDSVHLGLFTLVGKTGRSLSERRLDNAMARLLDHMRSGLRAGDIVAQCSSSQVVLMLLQANYENSSLVCGRITESFGRSHPRLPVEVSVVVLPLEPVQDAAIDAGEPPMRGVWTEA